MVIQALRRAPASVVAPIGYAELVGAATLGFLVFGDVPDGLTWAGAALIVASGLIIAWREGVKRHSRAARIGATGPAVTLIIVGWLLVAFAVALYLRG